MNALARREQMRNTALMGHPGDWSKRKRAFEADRLREVEAAEAERTKLVTFYAVGRGLDVYALHPCKTAADELRVEALCHGCRKLSVIEVAPLLTGIWAHAPWVRIMPTLSCSDCGEKPEELSFFHPGFNGTERNFVGKLTVRRPSEEELEALGPKKRKVWGSRTFKPEELVWRRLGAPGVRKR